MKSQDNKQSKVDNLVTTLKGVFPRAVLAEDLPKENVIPKDPHSVEK